MKKYIKLFEDFRESGDLDLNKILDSYLETALWTEEEQLKEGDDVDINIFNISDNSKIKAYQDIKKFLAMDGVMDAIREEGLDEKTIGHNLWLNRNGHGAGFWDMMIDNGDLLSDASKALGSEDLYVGDDGKLYFMGE